jgi:hypothetical protein
LAAAGYTVHPAQPGSNDVYSWVRTSRFSWDIDERPENIAAAMQCAARFAPVRQWTAAELREIYDLWVLEAQCLVSLGFHPREPPTIAEFYEDWKTGPWSPIDGIPFERIRGEAKDRCGLEMVE